MSNLIVVPSFMADVEKMLTSEAFLKKIGGSVAIRGRTGNSLTFKHIQSDGLVTSYTVKLKEK